jgi:hypothetical protein
MVAYSKWFAKKVAEPEGNTCKGETHHMLKKNRIATILMILLMITWFTPFIIRDNIAVGTILYAFNLQVIQPTPGYATWDVATDGNFTYVADDDGGLIIYNSTSLNYLTSIDNGSHYLGVDTFTNGNSVYIAVACQIEGLRMYNFTYINSTSYTLTLCDTINASLENTMPYINSTGTVFCGAGNDGINAYSFDYGGTDNFTWLGGRNDGTSITGGVIDVTSDRGYIIASCEDLGLRVYTFNGATFTLITTKDDSTADYLSIFVDKNNYIYTTCGNSASSPGYKDEVLVYTFFASTLNLKYRMTLATTSSTQTYITGDNNYIYLDHSINGITAYTLYNGVTMTQLSTKKDGVSGYYRLAVDNNYIYCTVQNLGLYIYTFTATTLTSISVITRPATTISYTYATLNGLIPNYVGDNVTDYGFQLGRTTTYSYGNLNSTYTSLVYNYFASKQPSLSSNAKATYYDGTYFYVASARQIEALTFDGTTFTSINTSSFYYGDQQSTHIYGDGTYLYIDASTGLTSSRLMAYTFNGVAFTHKANLTLSGFFHIANQNNLKEIPIYYDGTYLYIHNSSGLTACTFNGTTFIKHGNISNSFWNICGDGTYIYTIGYTLNAYTFNGTTFVLRGTINDDWVDGSYCDVTTNGNYIFATDYYANAPVRAYSFNGATFTLIISSLLGAINTARDMAVNNNSVYIGESDYLYYLSFNGSLFTSVTSWHTLGWDIISPFVVNNYLFTLGGVKLLCFSFIISLNATGLSPGTLYHFRAYATNSHGISYGIDRMFTTLLLGSVPISIGVNVYNESNGSQSIPFNIMIKNLNGTQVYSLLNQHNTLHINTSALTGNQNILIKVWSLGYRERFITVPLYTSLTANYTFFLPRELMGAGADPGGGSGYSPNSDIITYIYNLRVVETIRTEYAEFDRPIAGALVNVLRFINATGRFETMSTLTTDTNGYCNLYLIPSVLYSFNITATLYDASRSDWNPVPPNPYQATELKIFRLTRTGQILPPVNFTYLMQNITYSLLPLTLQNQGPITFNYTIHSKDNRLQWYRMTVSFYNVSNHTWTVLYAHNHSDASGGSISYTTPNITGQYKVDIWFKKTGFNEYKIYETGSLHYTIIYIKAWIKQLPDLVWYLVTVVLMIIIMGFCYTKLGAGLFTGYIGLGVFAFSLLLKPGLTINGFSGWVIWAITFLIYTMGMFLWSRL